MKSCFCRYVQVSTIHGRASDLQQETTGEQVHRLFAQSPRTYVMGVAHIILFCPLI